MKHTDNTFTYPFTRTVDQVDTYHGVQVADPYRWLEDDRSPETEAWVAEQNNYTGACLAALPHRNKFRDRITELFNSPRYTSPRRYGDRYFYVKNDGLQNHGVLYMEDAAGGEPIMVIDPNTFSEEGTISMSDMEVSEDGRILAYAISDSGSDWQEIRLRDIDARADMPDCVQWVKFSGISWTHDGRGFFYSRFEEPAPDMVLSGSLRNHRICYHRLGTDQSEDPVIFEQPDNPEWIFYSGVSTDGRYLIISSYHQGYERLFVADLLDPLNPHIDAPVVDLIGSFDAHYTYVGNNGTELYIRTDKDAPRGRIIGVDIGSGNAVRTIVDEQEDVLEAGVVINDLFLLTYMHNAYHRPFLFDREGRQVREIALPTLGTVYIPDRSPINGEVFYTFTSFLYPNTVFRYDMGTDTHEVFRKNELDLNEDAYETTQLWCTSKDGTRVPMFVTRRRDIVLDGTTRAMLYGYGGFGSSQTPMFSRWGMLWLEQGGVLAVANIRGGGEFGEAWHRGGIRERKQNSYDDFIAAAEHLIATGHTSSSRLAIFGASNGGLLVSAVMCQRPELFGVAVPQVAVTDMLRFQKFTIGMAWQGDYGLSDDPEMFGALYAYSPYHNLRPGTVYPATLVETADHDDRVVPAHSFKFVARLQAAQAGAEPVLLRVSYGAGHGAGQPVAMMIDEITDTIAFMVHHTTQPNLTESQTN